MVRYCVVCRDDHKAPEFARGLCKFHFDILYYLQIAMGISLGIGMMFYCYLILR